MYDVDNQSKTSVKVLEYSTCTKLDSYIRGMENYFSTWITGSTNHRASNITDHAASEPHKVAVMCVRTDQAKATNLEQSLIAKSLLAFQKPMQEKF